MVWGPVAWDFRDIPNSCFQKGILGVQTTPKPPINHPSKMERVKESWKQNWTQTTCCKSESSGHQNTSPSPKSSGYFSTRVKWWFNGGLMVMNQIVCKKLLFAMCSVYQCIHNFCGSYCLFFWLESFQKIKRVLRTSPTWLDLHILPPFNGDSPTNSAYKTPRSIISLVAKHKLSIFLGGMNLSSLQIVPWKSQL